MVYSGKPSTGCYLCRRRKIKCDEGRPGCKNCEIYGKQCPGYRPAIVVEDKGYSKWKLLANKNYNNDAAILDPDSAGRLALIPRWLAEASVDDRALCYFFDQYTTKRTPDGLPGVLESIPLLYVLCRESEVAGSPSSCLRWAVEAAALTSFAHETNDQRLDLVARERYVMALRGLNKALSTPMENLQDATLATILLLVIFEDLNGERAELVSSHTAGLELVARLHTSRRQDGRDRCIFDFAIAQLQIQIIGIGGRPQLNLQFLVDLLDQSDPVQSLMVITTKLCQLLVDVPALHDHEEDCRVYSEELTLEDLTGYLLHTQSLDEELSQWCQSVPELWLPRIVYSTTGDTFITYPSISTGSVWNFYRCARIIIRGIIDALTEDIMAMTSMSGNENDSCWLLTSPGQSTHSDIVQNMIVDICRSIPFLLGDVDSSGRPARPNATSTAAAATTPRHSDFSRRLKAIEGYEMLWPFWHVLQSRFSTLKQRMQAQEALRRLDQDFGIRLASKLADISPCSLPRQE